MLFIQSFKPGALHMHAHTILWIKDAPKLGVDFDADIAGFVDTYIHCSIPEDEELAGWCVRSRSTDTLPHAKGMVTVVSSIPGVTKFWGPPKFRDPHPQNFNILGTPSLKS